MLRIFGLLFNDWLWVETVVLRFISTFCSLHTIQDSVQMVLFSTQILPFRIASANHCCTLMAASLKRMIMIMIKTAMTLLNIVMSNRQRFSHYLTQIWSTNVLLLRFFRKKIKMKIISKNMIVTTIPSGGANVNLFFALFPRADKMLIGSIIASGFRDKKHSRNDAEDILRIAHLKIALQWAFLGFSTLIFTNIWSWWKGYKKQWLFDILGLEC